MDAGRFQKQLDFIIEIDKAKQILRNTLLADSSRLENDAEHMWHMAVAAMVLSEYTDSKELDMQKVLRIILLHDVIEIYSGDTFAYDVKGQVGKEDREREAAEKLFAILPEDQAVEFKSLWDEFEDGVTDEAKFALAMDSFMPTLHNYITKGQQWRHFDVSSKHVLAKNERIAKSSGFLWKYIQHIVEDSVKKGYLRK